MIRSILNILGWAMLAIALLAPLAYMASWDLTVVPVAVVAAAVGVLWFWAALWLILR